jgi:hypothetical protein
VGGWISAKFLLVVRLLTHDRVALVPLGCLLVGVADAQEAALAEGATQKLKSHGEINAVAVGESAGEAEAADAGKVRGDREDVGEVHLERVIGLLAKSEGGLG